MEVLREGYRIPFRRAPTIRGAHPFFGLLPQFHPGQSFGAGSGVAAPEGSYRVGSTSFSRLLQPSFCGDGSLVVVVGLVRCEEGLGNGSGVVICPGRFNHATTASSEHPD